MQLKTVACSFKVKMWCARKAAATRTPQLVYALIVLLVINGCTTAQNLPTRDELDFQLHRNHPEIFYDTKLLPDGAEVTSYVVKRVTSRWVAFRFVSFSISVRLKVFGFLRYYRDDISGTHTNYDTGKINRNRDTLSKKRLGQSVTIFAYFASQCGVWVYIQPVLCNVFRFMEWLGQTNR